ncbi:MAG: ATP-binding cassette domain-containing protein [Pirellulaceae bacterium]
MLQGMYSPQQGLLRIDGLDIRELDISHLRQNIGVVLQDNFLFRGTVKENISMAKSNASFQEVVYAARLAGADEFIERFRSPTTRYWKKTVRTFPAVKNNAWQLLAHC